MGNPAAVEIVEFSHKHTANVHELFGQIRRIIENLVARRDQRRDGFAEVIRKAMHAKFGDDANEVLSVLRKQGITRKLAKGVVDIAGRQGSFTIFALVDALTQISGRLENAGDRSEADQRATSLLALTAAAWFLKVPKDPRHRASSAQNRTFQLRSRYYD